MKKVLAVAALVALMVTSSMGIGHAQQARRNYAGPQQAGWTCPWGGPGGGAGRGGAYCVPGGRGQGMGPGNMNGGGAGGNRGPQNRP